MTTYKANLIWEYSIDSACPTVWTIDEIYEGEAEWKCSAERDEALTIVTN